MSVIIDFPKIEYRGFEIHDRFPYAKVHAKDSRQCLWEGSVNSCKEWIDDFWRWANK